MNTETAPLLSLKYDPLTRRERFLLRCYYIQEQNGLCYHCHHELENDPPEELKALFIDWSLFPKNFQRYPIHLHHDHETGLTLGAVHSLCNAVLFCYHGE